MVVAPLVPVLLVCSAADVGDFRTLGKIGGKTPIIFLGGTAIGPVVCNIMNIGAGFVMSTDVSCAAKEVPGVTDALPDIAFHRSIAWNLLSRAWYHARYRFSSFLRQWQ